MKRYSCHLFSNEEDIGWNITKEMVEDQNGEWVRYDDAEKEKAIAVANAILMLEKKKMDDFRKNINDNSPCFKMCSGL